MVKRSTISVYVCRGFCLAFLFFSSGILPLNAQNRADRLERSIRFIQDGQYSEAIRNLRFYTNSLRGNRDADGFYYLALSYWKRDTDDVRLASQSLHRALELGDDDPKILSLRLEMLQSGLSFFSPITAFDHEILSLASRLLSVDSGDPLAHAALGDLAFRKYAPQGHLRYKRPDIAEYRDNAIEHFETAIRNGRIDWKNVEPLFIMYAQNEGYGSKARWLAFLASGTFPEKIPKINLWLACAHFKSGDLKHADELITATLPSLPDSLHTWFGRITFETLGPYEENPESNTGRYVDTIWSTPVNEREVEHRVRVSYAYLFDWLGTPKGQVVIRYGFPGTKSTSEESGSGWARMKEIASAGGDVAFDREVWYYGDMAFGFLAHPYQESTNSFYSPSASRYGNSNAADRDALSKMDDTLTGPAYFMKTPERTQTIPDDRVRFPYEIVSFKGEDDLSEVWVISGIPLTTQENSISTESEIRDSYQVGTFLVDSLGSLAEKTINTVDFRKTARLVDLPDQTLMVETADLLVHPGDFSYSIELVKNQEELVGIEKGSTNIPSFHSENRDISSLLLGYFMEESEPNGQLPHRNGVSIQPAPWGVFYRDQPIYVYFEAYNYNRGSGRTGNYTIEASLTPVREQSTRLLDRLWDTLRPRDKSGVSITFEAIAESSIDSRYIILDTSDQESGQYILTLSIIDRESDEPVVRTRRLYLQ